MSSVAGRTCNKEAKLAEVVVIGGGIIGSCCALFLARAGAAVTIVERDLEYATSSTTRSASAIRQQFHLGINVAMSHFGYEFFTHLDSYLPDSEEADIGFVERGYLILATEDALDRLRVAHERQVQNGAQVELLQRAELEQRFPWLKTQDIGAATFGTGGEGWFDPIKALQVVRRAVQAAGATYVEDEVTKVHVDEGRVRGVELASGRSISSSQVINAAGPAAGAIAAMVGDRVPVEGRKRTVFLFRPTDAVEGVPNVVDPTVAGRGLYLRPYEDVFMAVIAPAPDQDPPTTDLEPDEYLFDEVIRSALASRIRGFEDVEVVRTWAGHYEMNTFDQNAIIGQHEEVEGFYFACGLSGHGVMHAPAVGRGIAELVTEGGYRTLDLSMFSVDRIRRGEHLDDVQPSETRRHRAGI
jgi:FAD-dependent oxidoreductase domain-containing protein 1